MIDKWINENNDKKRCYDCGGSAAYFKLMQLDNAWVCATCANKRIKEMGD